VGSFRRGPSLCGGDGGKPVRKGKGEMKAEDEEMKGRETKRDERSKGD
jgi:hypothetical protein